MQNKKQIAEVCIAPNTIYENRKLELDAIPKKVKIVFAGGRRLGVEVLKWLCTLEWVEIVAVCPIPAELDCEVAGEMRQIIRDNKLLECKINELRGAKCDIGLSVNCHRIIPADILDICTNGFYNIHHSYNLRLRGRNITTHAILNRLKEGINYHGTTLHKMVPELDAGPIVASVACDISFDDTAYTLFKKADSLALQLIMEWLPRIAFQRVYMYAPPKSGVHNYRNADLPPKEIPADILSPEEIYDYVRAFDFPGNEPAYILKGGKKYGLTINIRNEYCHAIRIKTFTYYTNQDGYTKGI